MPTLRDTLGIELLWEQDGLLSRQYELRGKDQVFAGLRWEGSFGSLASATTESGSYTFKRTGFLRPRVTVRPSGADTEVATFQPNWLGHGPLLIQSARQYYWSNAGFWQAAWGFASPDGARLVEFRPRFSVARKITGVEIAPSALANPDVPLLAAFGWYLLVMMAQESGGAAAVIMMSS